MKPDQIHPQQARENPEPHEGARPMPWVVVTLTAALLVFAVVYIARSGITAPPTWGDGRTLAELQGTPAAAGAAAAVDGAAVYAARCAACHQAAGTGLAGAFPPLAGSEWVAGKAATVVAIVLHGVTGTLTVKGGKYNGVMPTFGPQLQDAEVAAVLTHLRSSWGNSAAPITAADVAAVRKDTAARSAPFNGDADLDALK
ncbi:MAG: cytochrome c [Rubrivivax sp.]